MSAGDGLAFVQAVCVLTKTTLGLLFVAACSSAAGGSGSEAIHAEVEPFTGFSYDSGQLPTGSPVTVDFAAKADGKITLDAPDGSPNAGTFAIDGEIALTGLATSTLPGASYSGPIMGAPDLSIQIAGSASFTAMATGQAATVTATIPQSQLMTLPLATMLGIPAVTGNLTLTLAGGTVTSQFTGTCASDGHFAGTLVTSGTVMLGGSLDVAVPLAGDMTFDLGTMTMTIPKVTTNLVFATPDDPMATGCSNGDGSGGGGGGGGGNGSGSAGGGSGSGGGGGGTQLWDVIAQEATWGDINGTTPWDSNGGLADPYMIITINGVDYQTSILQDQSGGFAGWNETIAIVTTQDLGTELDIEVLDRDTDSSDHRRTDISDPSHPEDDVIASMGLSSQFYADGQSHTEDATYDGTAASITFAIVPHAN